MFLTSSEQAAQIERFLARLPKGLVHDAARPVAERLASIPVFPPDALRVSPAPEYARVTEHVNWAAEARRLTDSMRPPSERDPESRRWRIQAGLDVAELRGFVLWADTELVETHKEWLAERGAVAACRAFSPAYFVDDQKRLWRLDLQLQGDTVKILGKPSSTTELVGECQDKTYGPLSMGHSLMLNQFGGAAKAARERASRLERLIQHVEDSTRLDEDSWQDYEYVIKWEGDPAMPQVIRDIRYNASRKKFLLREWEVGRELHMVREFDAVEAAITEANKSHGYLRRRAGGAR